MFGFLEASLTRLCVQHARERRAADYERAWRGTPAAVGVEVNGKVGSSKCEVNDKEATPSTTLLSLPPSPAHRFSHPHPGRDEKREAGHRVVKSRLAPPLVLEKVGGEPIPRVFRVVPVVGANLVRLLWETMENVKFYQASGNGERRREGRGQGLRVTSPRALLLGGGDVIIGERRKSQKGARTFAGMPGMVRMTTRATHRLCV